MSGAGYGSNAGKGLMEGMGNYYNQKMAKSDIALKQQQVGMGNMQMQQLQQEMPMRMGILKRVGEILHGANNDPQVGQQIQGLMGSQQSQQPSQGSALMPSSVPTIPGAPAGFGSAPPIQAAPVQMPQQSAQQAPQQQQSQPQPGGNPMQLAQAGALGGLVGMPGAQGLMDYSKLQMENDPQNATRMESAKSQIAQDQYQIQQAQAQGNSTLAAGLQQKMRQDLGLLHVASMSGTQTRVGLDGGISTFNPNEGVQTNNGIESVIPGATGARGALAAAESVGKAQGETVEVTDKDGNKYLVPKSTIVGGGRSTGNTPGVGASGVPSAPNGLSEISPAAAAMRVGNAKQALETNKEFQDQAEAGNSMLSQVQTLRNSAADFTPGRFADSRAAMLDYLNSTNLISADQKKSLGSYQEGQKIAIQLQAAATKQLGSREAAQVFQYMGKSLPNLTLSQNGLEKVSAWQEGISRYQIARAQDANTQAQSNNATAVNQMRDNWIKGSNPLFYVMASAKPDVRQEMIGSLGSNKQKFLTEWNNAARSGMAPRPNDYWQQ